MRVRRAAFAILAALTAVLGWATYVLAAPAFQSGPGVHRHPRADTYADPDSFGAGHGNTGAAAHTHRHPGPWDHDPVGSPWE